MPHASYHEGSVPEQVTVSREQCKIETLLLQAMIRNDMWPSYNSDIS